jgi:hypothetical protein
LEEVIIKKRVEGGFVQDLVQALVPGQSPGQSLGHAQDQFPMIRGEVVALLKNQKSVSVRAPSLLILTISQKKLNWLEEVKKRATGGFVQDLGQALVQGQSPNQSQGHVQDQLPMIRGKVVALLRQGSVGVLVLHLWSLVIMVSFFTIYNLIFTINNINNEQMKNPTKSKWKNLENKVKIKLNFSPKFQTRMIQVRNDSKIYKLYYERSNVLNLFYFLGPEEEEGRQESEKAQESDLDNNKRKPDVIHTGESDVEMEEPEEEPLPETRIDVEIPKITTDLGKAIHFVKLPNFLSVETRPFDPTTYEDEIDDEETLDEEGRARLKLKVENTIRWRERFNEKGVFVKESNSRFVKWSDGSMSLHLGNEIFNVYSQPLQVYNFNLYCELLYIVM